MYLSALKDLAGFPAAAAQDGGSLDFLTPSLSTGNNKAVHSAPFSALEGTHNRQCWLRKEVFPSRHMNGGEFRKM